MKITIDSDEAQTFGVNGAAFLSVIRELLKAQESDDGWAYANYDTLLGSLTWISESTLRRVIRQLQAENVIEVSQKNEDVFDRTASYAITPGVLSSIVAEEFEADMPIRSERQDDLEDLKDLEEDFDPEDFLMNFPAYKISEKYKDLETLRKFLKDCPIAIFDGWDADRIAELIKVVVANDNYEITLDLMVPETAGEVTKNRLIIGALLAHLFEKVGRNLAMPSKNGDEERQEIHIPVLPLPDDWREWSYNGKRGHLQDVFEHASSVYIGHCPEKSRPTLWWNPIRNLLTACDGDIPAARRVMIKAIRHMREIDYTISSPKSIEKAMLSGVANRFVE